MPWRRPDNPPSIFDAPAGALLSVRVTRVEPGVAQAGITTVCPACAGRSSFTAEATTLFVALNASATTENLPPESRQPLPSCMLVATWVALLIGVSVQP